MTQVYRVQGGATFTKRLDDGQNEELVCDRCHATVASTTASKFLDEATARQTVGREHVCELLG